MANWENKWNDFKTEDSRKELAVIQDATAWIKENAEAIKNAASVSEESGVYPHDCITRVTVDFSDDEHSLYYEEEFYSDRDGGEDDPQVVEFSVDGINIEYAKGKEVWDLKDALWDIVEGLVY